MSSSTSHSPVLLAAPLQALQLKPTSTGNTPPPDSNASSDATQASSRDVPAAPVAALAPSLAPSLKPLKSMDLSPTAFLSVPTPPLHSNTSPFASSSPFGATLLNSSFQLSRSDSTTPCLSPSVSHASSSPASPFMSQPSAGTTSSSPYFKPPPHSHSAMPTPHRSSLHSLSHSLPAHPSQPSYSHVPVLAATSFSLTPTTQPQPHTHSHTHTHTQQHTHVPAPSIHTTNLQCHHCSAVKPGSSFIFCQSTHRGGGKCSKYFCSHCLKTYYPFTLQQNCSSWQCPSCQHICMCAVCAQQPVSNSNHHHHHHHHSSHSSTPATYSLSLPSSPSLAPSQPHLSASSAVPAHSTRKYYSRQHNGTMSARRSMMNSNNDAHDDNKIFLQPPPDAHPDPSASTRSARYHSLPSSPSINPFNPSNIFSAQAQQRRSWQADPPLPAKSILVSPRRGSAKFTWSTAHPHQVTAHKSTASSASTSSSDSNTPSQHASTAKQINACNLSASTSACTSTSASPNLHSFNAASISTPANRKRKSLVAPIDFASLNKHASTQHEPVNDNANNALKHDSHHDTHTSSTDPHAHVTNTSISIDHVQVVSSSYSGSWAPQPSPKRQPASLESLGSLSNHFVTKQFISSQAAHAQQSTLNISHMEEPSFLPTSHSVCSDMNAVESYPHLPSPNLEPTNIDIISMSPTLQMALCENSSDPVVEVMESDLMVSGRISAFEGSSDKEDEQPTQAPVDITAWINQLKQQIEQLQHENNIINGTTAAVPTASATSTALPIHAAPSSSSAFTFQPSPVLLFPPSALPNLAASHTPEASPTVTPTITPTISPSGANAANLASLIAPPATSVQLNVGYSLLQLFAKLGVTQSEQQWNQIVQQLTEEQSNAVATYLAWLRTPMA